MVITDFAVSLREVPENNIVFVNQPALSAYIEDRDLIMFLFCDKLI